MARFIGDQQKTVLIHESGAYATVSGGGVWLGQVTDNAIDDQEGKFIQRYMGTATRSFASVEPGPRDVTGTLTYFPQDMRLPFWTIGSVVDTSGANSFHLATEINSNVRQSAFTSGALNPPISFTIEDSKTSLAAGSNFVRTINGCIPMKTTLTAKQSEKVEVAVDYIGQTLTYSSGAATAVTAYTSRPYLWSDCTFVLSGTTLTTAKEIEIVIDEGTQGPHYLNGSRDISVPYQGNREYTLNVTMDWEDTTSKDIYQNLFKSNGVFNCTFDMNADSTAGSQHAIIFLSGCRIITAEIPSPFEAETTEAKLEIRPQFVIGSSFDSQAGNARYNIF